MKRFLTLLMALTLVLALAACGGEEQPADTGNEDASQTQTEGDTTPAAGVDLEALKAQMLADAGITDYIDVPAENLGNVYGIEADQVVSAAAFNAMTGGAFPEEVVLVQAVDEAAAADVADKLQAKLDAIAEQAASYDPDSLELAQNCDIVTDGVYVGLFFTQHYDAMASAFQNAIG